MANSRLSSRSISIVVPRRFGSGQRRAAPGACASVRANVGGRGSARRRREEEQHPLNSPVSANGRLRLICRPRRRGRATPSAGWRRGCRRIETAEEGHGDRRIAVARRDLRHQLADRPGDPQTPARPASAPENSSTNQTRRFSRKPTKPAARRSRPSTRTWKPRKLRCASTQTAASASRPNNAPRCTGCPRTAPAGGWPRRTAPTAGS